MPECMLLSYTPASLLAPRCTLQGIWALFGGVSRTKAQNDLWIFDFETEQWSEVTLQGAHALPRYFHMACFTEAASLLVAGGELPLQWCHLECTARCQPPLWSDLAAKHALPAGDTLWPACETAAHLAPTS